MAAFDGLVTLENSAEWTLITSNDVSAITFKNMGGGMVEIKTGTSATLPANTVIGRAYYAGDGAINVSLSSIAPGVTSAVRVFARSINGSQLWVSHA